jgi:hypothetical protein
MRPICYVSNLSRLTVVPLVWWGIFGLGGPSGFELIKARLKLGSVGAAAATALFLATVSTASLLPCSMHRRLLRKRAAACACGRK